MFTAIILTLPCLLGAPDAGAAPRPAPRQRAVVRAAPSPAQVSLGFGETIRQAVRANPDLRRAGIDLRQGERMREDWFPMVYRDSKADSF